MGRREGRIYDGLLGPEPYEAFIPHPVSGWTLRPEEQTARRVEDAADRLRAFGQTVEPSTALRWCLNRSEGIASSDVEGISTTLRSLSLLESLRGHRDADRRARDQQALGAVRLNAYAIAVGQRRPQRLSASDIEEMHRRLFEGTDQPFETGRFREREVWVGAPGARSPARAHYVPPPHEFVAPLVDDLVAYLSSPSWVHPLAKAFLSHLQFETIHPFLDGNGRVGRALMHSVIQRGLPGPMAVPLSAAIGERKQDYIESLRPYQTYEGASDTEVRAATAEVSISYLARATVVACDYAQVVAESIAGMHRGWDNLKLRSHSAAAAALAEMSTMPAATVAYLSDKTGRPAGSIRRGLRRLVDSGAVAESVDEDSGRTVFELPAMLDVVDQRSALLDRCWTLRDAGDEVSATDLLDRLRRGSPTQPTPQ
ncbi:MAG: Fic family protein [bacterium]|nr:Fic family protein [bacterium]